MAYVNYTTSKRGVLVARIHVSGKDPKTNENKVFTQRVYNEEGLTEAKFKKKVNLIAATLEEQVIRDYEDHVETIHTTVLTFPQLAEEWIATIDANLSHSYYLRAVDATNRFTKYLKSVRLDRVPISKIRVRDVQLFLNSFSIGYVKGRPLAKLIKPLPETVNFRELSRDKVITRQSSYLMNKKDKNILLDSAQTICERYGLSFDEYFKDVTTREPYSPTTIKGFRRVLRTVFNEAIRYEWITKNPVSATKIGASSGNATLRPVEEKEVYSIKETQEFIRVLNELSPELIYQKIPLKIMILAGLRSAEVCGLRWSDIDFEKGVINVNRNRLYSSKKGVYEKDPKTKTSKRSVPIPKALLEDLREYEKWFEIVVTDFHNKLDDYYIASTIYREPIFPSTLSHVLARIQEKHSLKKVTCHGLRHTYCSILLSQGVPIQTVSRYMGHSDSTVTLQVYAHFVPDTQEIAIDALDKLT